MNQITNVLVNILNAGLMVYVFMLFFSSFSSKRLKAIPTLAIVTAVIAVFTAALLFIKHPALKIVILLSLTFILSQLYLIKWHNGILLSVLVFALGMLSEYAVASLISILFSVDTQTALEGPFYILGLLLSKLLAFIAIIVIRIAKNKNLYSGSFKKILVIVLFPFSTIVILFLQYYYFTLIPKNNPTSMFISILCYIFLIASNIVVLDMLEHIYQDAEKENQLNFAQKLIVSQEEQYQQLMQNNQNILKIRHDHKNFVMGLLSELDSRHYDSVHDALEAQLNELQLPSNMSSSGIIGSVIHIKSQTASSYGISIDVAYSKLNQINISEIDLAIILGNALDNAIEAVQKTSDENKQIFVSVKTHNNQIIISVKNKVENDIDTSELKTTKTNSELHGFGILSIKNIASKYSGDVLLSCIDKIFEIHIILRNTAPKQ